MEEEITLIDPGLPGRLMITHLEELSMLETPVTEMPKLKIFRYEDRNVRDPRWNCPYRIILVNFLTFMAMLTRPTHETFNLWSQREGDWEAEEIPRLPTDRASLRINVWAGKLPNPRLHLEQVLIRIPWLRQRIRPELLLNWFMRNVRGAPEIILDQGQNRRRRCQICSSNVLGYPLNHHHWTNCVFRRLDGIHRLMFMAINTRAFCSRCGVWSVDHTDYNCVEPDKPRKCLNCGAADHQLFQELCKYQHVMGAIDEHAQDQRAHDTLKDHYARCKRLAEEGLLAYRCQSDYPDKQTADLLLKLRRQDGPMILKGWCKFSDYMYQQFRPIPAEQYTMRTEFEGLYSQEVSSAQVNSTPVFEPEDIDRIFIYGMILDKRRFDEYIFRGRNGNERLFVIPQNRGARAEIRNGPRFQIPRPPPVPPLPNNPPPVIRIRGAIAQAAQRVADMVGARAHPMEQGAIEVVNNPVVEEIVEIPEQRGASPQAEAPADHPVNPQPEENGERAYSSDGWGPDPYKHPEATEKSPEPANGTGNVSTEERKETSQSSGAKDDASIEAESEEEPQDLNESPDFHESPEVNRVPVARAQFDRAHSFWFTFDALNVMPEPEELREEKTFILNMKEKCGIHIVSRMVTSSHQTLDSICRKPIPQHTSSIQARINFLLFSLTGRDHMIKGATDYPVIVLQDYVAYLQGIHRFIDDVGVRGKCLAFRITSCWKAVQLSPAHQAFNVPNLELFDSMTPNEVFKHSESYWSVYTEEVQTTQCQCHELG